MKILHFIIKNTSTLDYAAPIYYKCQGRGKINVTIFVAKLDKNEIFKGSIFWAKFIKDNNIVVKSYLDYLIINNHFIKKLILKIVFYTNYFDNLLLKYKNIEKSYGCGGLIIFFYKLGFIFFKKIESIVGRKLINHNKVLDDISPDIIFFDNRGDTKIYGRNDYFKWFYSRKRPVYLLPHAPHLRDPISEFVPFDSSGEELPLFAEFWMPFKFGKPWLAVEERCKDQFFFTGYPGFDSDWLSQFKSRNTNAVCFLMRQYVYIKNEKTDSYVLTHEETFSAIKNILIALNSINSNIKLILKPHPSNNINQINQDLLAAKIYNVQITNEPIYECLNMADIFLGFFSTALLVPAIAGHKTIFIDSSLQPIIYKQWDILSELYKNWPVASNHYIDIADKIKNYQNSINCSNIRNFYEDNAVDNILNRII